MQIVTASWFTPLSPQYKRISISRGTPRGQPAGFRLYRALAPGDWFNRLKGMEYFTRYKTEVLDRLDPHQVADDLARLSDGLIPALLCFERADGSSVCHRCYAAKWLARGLGSPVPEVGFEELAQDQHPLAPPFLSNVLQ
jgi:hypothetical protein